MDITLESKPEKKALLVFVSKKTLGFAHSYKDTFSSFFLPLTILVFVALGEVFDLLCLHSRPAQCHKAHKVHLEYIVSQLRQHMNVVEEHWRVVEPYCKIWLHVFHWAKERLIDCQYAKPEQTAKAETQKHLINSAFIASATCEKTTLHSACWSFTVAQPPVRSLKLWLGVPCKSSLNDANCFETGIAHGQLEHQNDNSEVRAFECSPTSSFWTVSSKSGSWQPRHCSSCQFSCLKFWPAAHC